MMKKSALATSILLALATAYVSGSAIAQSADSQSAQTQAGNDADKNSKSQQLQTITVTGSLIPQSQIETATPVVTISGADIQKQGFATVYDALHSIPISTGGVQGNQASGGFTQGAQTISLFGLPPSFTLILINGHPVTNYPVPYNGSNNIVDLSTIPAAMVDHIDIVSGGQSAIYGSSAIAGVVNIVLKDHAEGLDLSYRVGGFSDGGGANERLQLVGGGRWGKLSGIFGLEVTNQDPIFGHQRSYTDSILDDPTLNGATPIPTRVFLEFDAINNKYFDPGAQACAQNSHVFFNSLKYDYRPGRGYFCGSTESVGTSTMLNQNRSASAYSSLKYDLSDNAQLYADVLFSYAAPKFNVGSNFQFWQSNENFLVPTTGYFFNPNSNTIETWQRLFSAEDFGGGQSAGERIYTRQYNATFGTRGTLGSSEWNYDVFYNRSQVNTTDSYRQFVQSKIDDFFLGPQLGTTSGYPVYSPDRTKLYTPFNESLYDSLSTRVVNKSLTWDQNLNAQVTNTSLFTLPAGDVGFAGVVQAGNEALHNPIDPQIAAGELLGLTGSSAAGTRNRFAVATEFRVPLLSTLTADVSGRYDQYRFSGTDAGKFTYKAGLEFRPIDSLLLRANYATAFRAPDMVNLFGSTGFFTSGTDYYLCRMAGYGPTTYQQCPNYTSQFKGALGSSHELANITADTFTYGFVYSPTSKLTLKADYERANITNEVQQLSIDNTLQREADCLLGQTVGGAAVDINSPSCKNYLSLVKRGSPTSPVNPNGILTVSTFPINAANEYQSGVQTEVNYSLDAGRFGDFGFDLRSFVELKHTFQQFPTDPVIDIYHDASYTDFKSIVNGSISWNIGNWSTTVFGVRYGKTPNYAQNATLSPWMIYSGSVKYNFDSDNAAISVAVNNIKNSRPPIDKTNSIYPYFNTYNYNAYGRQLWVQFDFHFGGKKE